MKNKTKTLSNFMKINEKHLNYPVSLIYMNIRSLRLNFTSLLVSINKIINKLKFIVLVETNISDNENNMYNIPGFNSLYLNRENKGGGIAVYINENINFTQVSHSTKSFESIQINANINNNNLSLLFLYRPPHLKVSEFLEEIETTITKIKSKQEIIIVGDVNIDIKKKNKTTTTYLDLLYSRGMRSMINESTREDLNQNTSTCIDHLFMKCNESNTLSHACIIATTISDHYSIFFCLSKQKNNQCREKFNTQGPILNNNLVNRKIRELNWNEFLITNQNPNDLYNTICEKFNEIYENSYKNVTRKKRSSNPWITEELINDCDIRDNLYKKWHNNKRNKNLELVYKKFRNHTNKKITSARNNYYRQKFFENRYDIRVTWQIINEIIGKKTNNIDETIIKHFNINNDNISNITNRFAENFNQNVNRLLHNCSIKTLCTVETTLQNSLYLEQVNENEIYNILKTLNIKKGAGLDHIRPKDLRNNADIFTPLITKLINDSLDNAIVPQLLKVSMIRPIFKSGSTDDYNNYRPIAVLSIIEKILEEVVVKRLTQFLQKYKIINKNQFGFQKGKSINKILGNFSNHVNKCLSDNLHCLVLYIDFSKAFDTLSHAKLIEILYNYGIRGNIYYWFKNYLELRSYRVKIKNTLSKETPSLHGVPQGSKLGPILYLLYANDMLRYLKDSKTFAYADDTAIIVSDKDLNIARQKMQDQLDIASKWSHDNGLIINANKTKLMHIKPRHLTSPPIEIKFHDYDCLHYKAQNPFNIKETCTTSIELVKTYKYLGVHVDSDFKWKTQVESVTKNLRKSSHILYHLSNSSTYNVLKQAYFSLAESYIRHGIAAWGNATHCRGLQVSQNQILKTLWKSYHIPGNNSNLNYNTTENRKNNPADIAKELKIPNVKTIYYTVLSNEFFNNNEFLKEIDHVYNTRHRAQGRYKVESFHNEYGRRTLNVTLPTIMNKIPTSILSIKNEFKRKKLIKNYFIESQ